MMLSRHQERKNIFWLVVDTNVFLVVHKKLTNNMTNILHYAILNIIRIGIRNNIRVVIL